MSELKTIAELIALADGNPAGALTMLRAARTLLDGVLGVAVIELPALPPPRDDVPRKRRYRRRNVGRATRRGKRKSVRSAAPLRRRRPAEPAADAVLKAPSNPVTVEGDVISFNGKSITVTPREAQVARQLVKVMPSLLGHDLIAQRVWPDASKETGMVCAAQATSALAKAVDAIGLKVTRVRGMGAAISEV